MQNEKRITDHENVLRLAREDAAKEGGRVVRMTVGELWRLIHHAPLTDDRGEQDLPGLSGT